MKKIDLKNNVFKKLSDLKHKEVFWSKELADWLFGHGFMITDPHFFIYDINMWTNDYYETPFTYKKGGLVLHERKSMGDTYQTPILLTFNDEGGLKYAIFYPNWVLNDVDYDDYDPDLPLADGWEDLYPSY